MGYRISMIRLLTSMINVGDSDLYFMVQCIRPLSWGLFDGWIWHFGIMSQCYITFDLILNKGHSDLYFIVQWFCPFSWGLFEGWTWYFGIMSQCDITFHPIINVSHSEGSCFRKMLQCEPAVACFSRQTRFRRATLSYDSTFFSRPCFPFL